MPRRPARRVAETLSWSTTPPSSILAKITNLDGSRSHGGKWDILAGAMFRDEPAPFTYVYRTLMTAARAEGIGAARLLDFLGLEHDGVSCGEGRAARVCAERAGQLRRTVRVLRAEPGTVRRQAHARSGHIKPWKDSTSAERIDLRNRLAACPSHDVAFDTGLLTVDVNLQVHVSGTLADAVRADRLTRQYYGRPPLRDTILLPDRARLPGRKYLDWHQTNVFVI